MVNKSKIPKIKLKKAYNEGLSSSKLAEFFSCSESKVWYWISKYNIKPNRIKVLKIKKSRLEYLYLKKKLSITQISKKLNFSKTTIENKLKKYGIRRRNHSEAGRLIKREDKYKIPVKELKRLYYDKKLSMQQIADKYGLYNSTIYNKFKKYKINSRTVEEGIFLAIPRRSKSIAKAMIKYQRKDFSNSLIEKSYLIGFRKGDLHITKNKYGETILVQCTSTKMDQINLIKQLFNKYGSLYINKQKNRSFRIVYSLNLSFEFLLDGEDKIERWILNNKQYFLAFLAGYIDAEGHFGISKGFPNFCIKSYDKNIICQTYKKLCSFGININKPFIAVKGGYIDKRGVPTHNDLWGIRIRKMEELFKFKSLIKPHIKHKKRYNDLIEVEKKIIERSKNFGRIKIN